MATIIVILSIYVPVWLISSKIMEDDTNDNKYRKKYRNKIQSK